MRNKFPKVTDTKIKESLFIGPQIRELMQDKLFDEDLNEPERNAWLSFRRNRKDFLGNQNAANCQDEMQDLLTSYTTVGCNMIMKIHFLESHVEFFPENLAEVSDEHGERFHQVCLGMENRYQGKWASSIFAEYCSTRKRGIPEAKQRRHSYSPTFRVTFLHDSLVRKVLIFTERVLCIFETLLME